MPKFGFVFPGQGSQKLGMLSDLAGSNRIIEETFAEASSVLGMDLWQICQHDGGNNLDQTSITQPVLLASSIAVYRLWEQCGGAAPAILAGHSLGEYSALVCAGALEFQDAVSVVHQRGRFMQSAVAEGAGKMAAIVGLENYQINEICDEAEAIGVVSAANFNSPGQTVIAGESAAVDRAIELCKEAGAKRALPLKVSVPSHCELMRPAAERLSAVLDEIRVSTPQIPVIQNVNAELSTTAQDIRANLVKQLYAPVLWVDCVQVISEAGISHLVECGPGKVLCGLIRRIDSEIACFGSEDQAALDSALAEMSA